MSTETLQIPLADLRQLREALMTQVIFVKQSAVAEVNRAIALADFLLGDETPVTIGHTIDEVRGAWIR